MRYVALSACIILLLHTVGCSSPKDANEGNFTKAIDAKLKGKPLCISVAQANTNYYISRVGNDLGPDSNPLKEDDILLKKQTTLWEKNNKETNDFFQDLSDARIVTELADNFREPGLFSMPYGVYMVSDKSKIPPIEPSKSKDSSPTLRFCLGHLAVDKIEEWSEPGDMMGHKVTSVKYTVKLVDKASWANRVISHYELDKPRESMLVLKNNGWSMDGGN